MTLGSAASVSDPISPRAKCRRPSYRRRRGRLPKAPATGRWWAAPWRPALISRNSNLQHLIGSLAAEKCFRESVGPAAPTHYLEASQGKPTCSAQSISPILRNPGRLSPRFYISDARIGASGVTVIIVDEPTNLN